jgi:predicted aminopeptidase
MARPLRMERVEGWYHITARGNERHDIYRDDRDRQHFCEVLAEMVTRFRIGLHAFVLREQRTLRAGVSSEPDPAMVRERLKQLRQYRWSSYRAYVGLGTRSTWRQRT